LIGEEILERFGSLPPGSDANGINGLAKTLSSPLGMPAEEVGRHLEPHLRDGHICVYPEPKGGLRWTWAPSRGQKASTPEHPESAENS
jgi:hypothetical protein